MNKVLDVMSAEQLNMSKVSDIVQQFHMKFNGYILKIYF